MEVKGFQTSFEVFAEAGAAAAADHTLPRCSVTSLQMTRLIPHSFQTQLISASLSLLPTPPMTLSDVSPARSETKTSGVQNNSHGDKFHPHMRSSVRRLSETPECPSSFAGEVS
ncbi:uncharacterized [Tachysurus ichikawai]